MKLRAIVAEWEVMKFVFAGYKKYGEVILAMATMAEMIEKIEDTQMVLGSMATNRAAAPFIDEVREWIGKLSQTSEIVEKWIGVQNKWMYMEAVFSGGDIVKQLPAEAKRFNTIDKTFMKEAQVETKGNHRRATRATPTSSTRAGSRAAEALGSMATPRNPRCSRSSRVPRRAARGVPEVPDRVLDTKRALFPRFYFISDPTLLEILSLGSTRSPSPRTSSRACSTPSRR